MSGSGHVLWPWRQSPAPKVSTRSVFNRSRGGTRGYGVASAACPKQKGCTACGATPRRKLSVTRRRRDDLGLGAGRTPRRARPVCAWRREIQITRRARAGGNGGLEPWTWTRLVVLNCSRCGWSPGTHELSIPAAGGAEPLVAARAASGAGHTHDSRVSHPNRTGACVVSLCGLQWAAMHLDRPTRWTATAYLQPNRSSSIYTWLFLAVVGGAFTTLMFVISCERHQYESQRKRTQPQGGKGSTSCARRSTG